MTQSVHYAVVDTNVPTSENFYTGTVVGPRWNVRRRYGLSGGWIALAPIPPTFRTKRLANGVMGYVAAMNINNDHGVSGPHAVHLYAHGLATAQQHRTGWSSLGHTVHGGRSALIADVPTANLAAQRYGPHVIGVINSSVTDEGVAPFVRTTVLDAPSVDFALYPNAQPAAAGGYSSPVSAQDLYVSDAADPFIWSYEGFSPWRNYVEFTGFRLSQANALGTNRTIVTPDSVFHRHRTGPTGAYRCRVGLPAEVAFPVPPQLVKPWSTDASEPPEVWFFVPEVLQLPVVGNVASGDKVTGRLAIYRARWRAGQRVRANFSNAPFGTPEVEALDDDPAFTDGRRRHPRLNPGGWAFERNWHDAAHLVGVAGPFTFNAPDLRIRVERDRQRYGVLHMTFVDFMNPYYQNGVANVWYSSSHDDGRHWSIPVQITSVENDI